MLHHTLISIGSDDVTMLRLQLFFFHTLRLRHTCQLEKACDVVSILERHQLSYADRYVQRKVSHSTGVTWWLQRAWRGGNKCLFNIFF